MSVVVRLSGSMDSAGIGTDEGWDIDDDGDDDDDDGDHDKSVDTDHSYTNNYSEKREEGEALPQKRERRLFRIEAFVSNTE